MMKGPGDRVCSRPGSRIRRHLASSIVLPGKVGRALRTHSGASKGLMGESRGCRGKGSPWGVKSGVS